LVITERSTDGIPLRVITMPTPDRDGRRGVLQLGRSAQGIVATLDALRTFALVGIPLTLLLAIDGGLFLAGRALGPIDRVRRAVGWINADNLSGRLGSPPRADEVGQLSATFARR
jgi:HAMP domain-containing protein